MKLVETKPNLGFPICRTKLPIMSFSKSHHHGIEFKIEIKFLDTNFVEEVVKVILTNSDNLPSSDLI